MLGRCLALPRRLRRLVGRQAASCSLSGAPGWASRNMQPCGGTGRAVWEHFEDLKDGLG